MVVKQGTSLYVIQIGHKGMFFPDEPPNEADFRLHQSRKSKLKDQCEHILICKENYDSYFRNRAVYNIND